VQVRIRGHERLDAIDVLGVDGLLQLPGLRPRGHGLRGEVGLQREPASRPVETLDDCLKLGVTCHQRAGPRGVAGLNRSPQVIRRDERFNVSPELRPAREAIATGDGELCVRDRRRGAGPEQIFGLILKMTEIRTIRKWTRGFWRVD